jgi:hypothetical protein
MYRCEVCQNVSAPREGRNTHNIMRTVTNPLPRTEIAREVICCHSCKGLLAEGIPLDFLIRHGGKAKRIGEPIAAPKPESKPTATPRSLPVSTDKVVSQLKAAAADIKVEEKGKRREKNRGKAQPAPVARAAETPPPAKKAPPRKPPKTNAQVAKPKAKNGPKPSVNGRAAPKRPKAGN